MLIHFNHKTPTYKTEITLSNHSIHAVTQCSFLGVTLDFNLKYKAHIAFLRQKFIYGIRILLKPRHYFTESTWMKLSFAFIHSHFNYCFSTWRNTWGEPGHLLLSDSSGIPLFREDMNIINRRDVGPMIIKGMWLWQPLRSWFRYAIYVTCSLPSLTHRRSSSSPTKAGYCTCLFQGLSH